MQNPIDNELGFGAWLGDTLGIYPVETNVKIRLSDPSSLIDPTFQGGANGSIVQQPQTGALSIEPSSPSTEFDLSALSDFGWDPFLASIPGGSFGPSGGIVNLGPYTPTPFDSGGYSAPTGLGF